MPSVAVDSSFLYALFEPKDRAHAGATRVLDTYRGDLVVNLPVLTEVAYLLDYSARAQSALLQFAARVLVIDSGTAADLPRIADIIVKYADLPADFADASLLAMAND